MSVVPALVCAVIGAASGLVAPRLIRGVPDIEPDPTEDPTDFPEAIPFAVLGADPRWRWPLAVVGAAIGAALGGVFGLVWGVGFILVVLPYLLALAVIDAVTWYLPDRLILAAAAAVAVVLVAAAIATSYPQVIAHSLAGGAGLLLWYGVFWLVSPRSLAFGDVKLAGVLGLVFGPFGFSAVVISVVAAALVSLLSLVPLHLLGRTINQGSSHGLLRAHLPFGPAMILGACISVLVARALGTV